MFAQAIRTEQLKGISAMNVQEARIHDVVADNTIEPLFIDRSLFPQRAATVAAAAKVEAEQVDRDACFPRTSIDTARQQRLLGVQIPLQFGGDRRRPLREQTAIDEQ